MHIQAVAVVGIVTLVAATTCTAEPQWRVQTHEDDFSGETSRIAGAEGRNGRIAVFVTCSATGYVVAFQLRHGIFADGTVSVRWDEGGIEAYDFSDEDDAVMAWSSPNPLGFGVGYQPTMREFVDKLRRHNELRVRVTRWPNTRVTDRIGLSGSSRTIGKLPCAR